MYVTISSIFVLILILFIPIKVKILNVKMYNYIFVKILFFKFKIKNQNMFKNKTNFKIFNYLNYIFKRIDIKEISIIKYHNLNNNLFINYSIKAIIVSYLFNRFRTVENVNYEIVFSNREDYDFNIILKTKILDIILIIWRIYGRKNKYTIEG